MKSQCLKYGSLDIETVEIFGEEVLSSDCPVMVYIHGGYWQALSREDSAFIVPQIVEAGIVIVLLGYPIAPQGTLPVQVAAVQKGVQFVLNWAKDRGSRGVFVCGHSAGGHLTLMSGITESCRKHPLLKGLIPISPIIDVRPLVHTNVNGVLKMDDAEAWECSPAKHLDELPQVAILLVVAEYDPPEFHRQAQECYEEMIKRGFDFKLKIISKTDHFDIVENLIDKDFELTKVIVNFVRGRARTQEDGM